MYLYLYLSLNTNININTKLNIRLVYFHSYFRKRSGKSPFEKPGNCFQATCATYHFWVDFHLWEDDILMIVDVMMKRKSKNSSWHHLVKERNLQQRSTPLYTGYNYKSQWLIIHPPKTGEPKPLTTAQLEGALPTSRPASQDRRHMALTKRLQHCASYQRTPCPPGQAAAELG